MNLNKKLLSLSNDHDIEHLKRCELTAQILKESEFKAKIKQNQKYNRKNVKNERNSVTFPPYY